MSKEELQHDQKKVEFFSKLLFYVSEVKKKKTQHKHNRLIGLVTMFLPKPPSVPGWWLYRCGHSRHCGSRQHLGCPSNSMCQSRPTQGRTCCLKRKRNVLSGVDFYETAQSQSTTGAFNYLPLVSCNNQQWTSCAKIQNPAIDEKLLLYVVSRLRSHWLTHIC